MPRDCRPAEQSEAAFMKERDDKISHLIGISMNRAGYPIRLFTTNRWITADNWYTADDVIKMLDRFEMENYLRRATVQDELELFYQPLVNTQTRSFVGVEALLRWNHPTKGRLSADAFIPLAEETGLIISMGRWVLRTACHQLRSWREQGVGALRVSVNISPREFRAPGFLESLAGILEETKMLPGELELELTERGVMRHDQKTLDVLREVQKMGVRLAVDDFGTGHTTFHYLKHFPLDTLKIDKSFTQMVFHLEALHHGEHRHLDEPERRRHRGRLAAPSRDRDVQLEGFRP